MRPRRAEKQVSGFSPVKVQTGDTYPSCSVIELEGYHRLGGAFSIARTSQKCSGSLPDRADRLASLSESQKEGEK